MDYTSIHIYGHLLSDDILHNIERDNTLIGNRDQDFGMDISVSSAIDYVWSSLRNDWNFYKERAGNERLVNKDPYGTRRARDLMERLLQSLGYKLDRQVANIEVAGTGYDISYTCPDLGNMPFVIIGENITTDGSINTLDKCSLDYRAKGNMRKKSAHATMLEYLNATENVYGIISNGQILRIIRNSGQLVKLTYIEFDLRRMLEEDKYTEFCLMFRLLHASRFRTSGDEPCVMERWFNMSIESGNRIRNGLSRAVQTTMETIGNAVLTSKGEGNDALRRAFADGTMDAARLNKELIHFIYRLLFLFIIEERGLVYQIPDSVDAPDYKQQCQWQDIYKKYYAASRLRRLSELSYLKQRQYSDLWQGLMDTFHLFEPDTFGEKLGIKPLGGVLFGTETLHWLKQCQVSNRDLLAAFAALNEFTDERQQRVKINYSSLDVEEFGSVYEGILEMRPFVQPGVAASDWQFGFVGGLDRQSTSSYYTRPNLVQNLIKTTLEPVIKEKMANCATTEEKVKALLNMKVCDAASGSGHIVLAMARTIAWYVCTLRTGEDNPASLDYRQALREVISRCVYAVDYNPDAVELCKVVLWIEGYCAGKPLSFLDHHIRCGNSVLGVSDLQMLIDGVPDKALTAEDKDTLKALKKMNQEAVKAVNGNTGNEPTLGFENPFGIEEMSIAQIGLADKIRFINHLPEETLEQEIVKQLRWQELMASARVDCLRRACDIYAYAFYHSVKADELYKDKGGTDKELDLEAEVPYTKTVMRALQEIEAMECLEKGEPLPTYYRQFSADFKTEVKRMAEEQRFFHWCVEFPEVFAANKGFDVMCGNPPWDKLQMEEEKWFAGKDEDIVKAANQAERKEKIAKLQTSAPKLYEEFTTACNALTSQSNFVKNSGRFPLTAVGKLELSSLFAELCLSFSKEAWGLVLPTGIAVNDSNKYFFSKLIDENRLMSIYSFENEEKLFDIHHSFKFCLLTCCGMKDTPHEVKGGFYLRRVDHLLDPRRIYTLKTSDFARLNPNTKTCPVFRTSRDASLTAKIYRNSTILLNEENGNNPWDVKFGSMFNMATDSNLFRTHAQLAEAGAILKGNVFTTIDGNKYVPLYEGKMIWHYNHHYGTWPTEGGRPNSINMPSLDELSNPNSYLIPWYWVPLTEVNERLKKRDNEGNLVWEWEHKWLIGFRKLTNATTERTFICTPIPNAKGLGDSVTLLYAERGTVPVASLCAMLTSLVYDYTVRQKVGGTNMNIFFVKQLPVLTPDQIPSAMQWQIVKRVAELCYFNHDMDGWASELWEEMSEEQRAELPQLGAQQPWVYNPERRAILQAELDAIFAHLYGLNTEDLHYILDPEDICGKGCINETFRVLKDNELRQYGEYRTKRLVLEAWDNFGFDN
ncbi:Eco57I restriction-modification methylase domain-containing protein [Prevotella sp.]|uniref:Eco57I restriction-modification methylase domain-containing protein n=1 Tax=Prevotella sp. TaxID=59823 RepID=UPI0025EDB923|nr:restriction endonuclease [Prevotella sp.]